MQILKLILLFVISFFASFLLFGLILPSSFDITQYIEIERPKEEVIKLVQDLNNRKEWYYIVDSTQLTSIKVEGSSDKGAKMSWKEGEVIIDAIDKKGFQTKVKFKDMPVNASFLTYNLNTDGNEYFEFQEAQQKTTVALRITGGPVDYPIGKIVMPAIRYKIYKNLEKSLFKLKEYAEANIILKDKNEQLPQQNNQQFIPQNTQDTTPQTDSSANSTNQGTETTPQN